MASRSSVIRVSVFGDTKDFQKAMGNTATTAEKWAGKMTKAGTAFTVGLTAPIVAGAAAAVKAGAEEAQQMEVLADVIRERIPAATDEMVASNEEWVASLQREIAVADGEIRDLEQRFLAAGHSVEESQRLTALAFDVAAQTGKEATSIADGFVRAANGQVAGLSRLGIETKNAAGETKSFAEITEELAETMGGTAASAADTAAGRAERLKLSMADLAENIGMLLLPLVEKLVGWLQGVADWFNGLPAPAQKMALAIAALAAAVGPLLLILGKLVSVFPMIRDGFDLVKKAFATNPWGLLIVATIALVTLIVTNWDKISAFLKRVWEGIKTGVNNLKTWITNTWNGIIDFFKGLPGRIASAAVGMWDGIKTAFRSAVNWLIDKWNGLKFTLGPLSIPSWIPGIGGKQIKLTLGTPNIPRLHTGGVFQAPGGAREGLALLESGERVIPRGISGGGETNVYITVNAGLGTDPYQLGRGIVEALQRYEKVNGAIPVAVRPA